MTKKEVLVFKVRGDELPQAQSLELLIKIIGIIFKTAIFTPLIYPQLSKGHV
ncbi:hypothetical protein [Aneurinibacillus aneurinilyticus]|jgi:hypothetical protein|uniref:Uncharacterized protein n=1 Tax=Aneurinibacillus aneurinilyticus TaxID=1391 RepID=A0A848D4K5_ANEAE|nr:hypothetical protein [Aneurinibacillus aneurinilyticus]MCI1695658.1 hypothetical protein [Aneurinibacillus aneurinilyticus]MED0669760.1 hypothetical protein [Aneurinibacillus aneurinilyticus]NMF00611.1 hypothetical protein [Aneurinibacillus aneurinilyticus]